MKSRLFDIRFVAAKADDCDYFYALRKTTMLEHFIRADKGWPEAEEFARHRQTFDDNLHSLRMIHLKDERIGFINVIVQDAGVDLELFCIEPHHQKKGIGTQVVQMILAEPSVKNKTIRLNVLHGNPAAHLYERLGFARMPTKHDKLVFYSLPAPK